MIKHVLSLSVMFYSLCTHARIQVKYYLPRDTITAVTISQTDIYLPAQTADFTR